MENLICPNCQRPLKNEPLVCVCGLVFHKIEGIVQFCLNRPNSCYTTKQIQHLRRIEKHHFWFKARRLLIITLLKRYLGIKKSVLDIGCGTGANAVEMDLAGFQVVGVDVEPNGMAERKKEHPSIEFFQATAHALPFKEGVFNAVVLADVLEHIDERALLEVDRVLASEGIALVTVPAYAFLSSARDEQVGHLRRYTKKQLRAIASQYGWKVEFLGGYQFCLLFLVFLLRKFKVSQKSEERIIPGINKLLYWLNALEIKLGIAWPWGTSLVGVFRKKSR